MKKVLDLDGLTHFWNKVKQSFGIRENSESIKAGDIRFLAGKENAGKVIMYTQDGTTSEQEPDFAYGESLGIIFPEYKDLNAVPLGLAIPNPLPYTPDGFVPALGQETTRETYPVWSYIEKYHPELILSEEEWQSKAAAQNGHVPYYSSGNGSTTFRFPCILHYFNATAVSQSVGGYAQEGLPNIEGQILDVMDWSISSASGAFKKSARQEQQAAGTASTGFSAFTFDASAYNSIYGNSDTVRPETCYGQWIIKAYGVTPTADEMTAAGIVQSVTNIETELAKDKIKTFTSLSQLGLSYESVTFESIAESMPANSVLMIWCSMGSASSNNPVNLNLPHNGLLLVHKGANSQVPVTFDLIEQGSKGLSRRSYGMYSSWSEFASFNGWYSLSSIIEQVQNATTGYIKYTDGRLEQWGQITTTQPITSGQTVSTTVSFPLSFSKTNYRTKLLLHDGNTNWSILAYRTYEYTTTTMRIAVRQHRDATDPTDPATITWEAKGWWK